MKDALEFSIDLAHQAGSLLQNYYNPAGLRTAQKADATVVTEADLAADKLIVCAIQDEFSGDEIISEESSHHIGDTGAPVWVIDPLDGTTNYSLGLAVWGVSIARLINGIPDTGVLYFPMLDELYVTRKGSGASLNQQPIRTRAPDPSQPMSFFACCSRSFRTYDISIPYKPRILGSAAYSFCMLARGVALLALDATPKLWDLAAAWLLVEEAGGVIAPFEGKPPFPLSTVDEFPSTIFPTLAAATTDLFAFGQKKIHQK